MEATQVFILGSGRNGSQTLACLLSAISGCHVAHEAHPVLLTETADYIHRRSNGERLRTLLAQTRTVEAIGGSRLSGESNQRLSLAINLLYEVFPNARYVWLVRDGRSVVASLYHRYWYHPREASIRPPGLKEWATTRIQADQAGDMSSAEWAELDSFGRCCWYWAFTNRLIGKELNRLPTLFFFCRLEQLAFQLPDLLTFLGLPTSAIPDVPQANKTSGRLPISWRHWSNDQRETFARIGGDVMDQLYPNWRAESTPSGIDRAIGYLRRGGKVLRELTRPVRVRIGLASISS